MLAALNVMQAERHIMSAAKLRPTTDRRVRAHSRRLLHSRQLDMIPGGLAWLSLVLTIIGAVLAPVALMWGVALLACYVAARFMLAGIAAVWGLRLVRRWESMDWHAEYVRHAAADSLSLEAVRHWVIIPNFREDTMILRRTLAHLAQQPNARAAITVILAMEAAESGAREKGERLRAAFESSFAYVFVTVHPANLPGETQCKSANLAWAARQATRALIDEGNHELDHVLVTTMDADTIWHPHHFASLSALFATDPQRYRTYWQAPIRYHGNGWAVHPLMRLLHAYSSAWELAYLAAPWWRALPMSSYSASLRLLHRAGYWDGDAIADEWHMYLKSYFREGGDQRLQPVFLPFLASATTGSTLWKSLVARYRQTFRHAWGAKEIGYALDQLMQRSRMPLRRSWGLVGRVAHDNLLAGAGWVILFLGAQLPVLLHPAWARAHVLTAPFLLLHVSVGIVTLLTLVFWALDVRIRPPQPEGWPVRARLVEVASLALVAVITVICVALPVLHAQTWLMLGKSIRFRVTAKL